MAICRIAMLDFMFDNPCRPENGYSVRDLIDLTEFCQAYLDEGLTKEPMDNFDLQEFINWATPVIAKG